jgi:hypothetical protein
MNGIAILIVVVPFLGFVMLARSVLHRLMHKLDQEHTSYRESQWSFIVPNKIIDIILCENK